MTSILLLNLTTSWIMVGVIWMVQLVHYPLMAHTGPLHSAPYQQLHVRKMATLVVPIMLTEAAAAVALCLATSSTAAWQSLFLLGLIWTVTGLMSVPAHDKLVERFSDSAHKALLHSNLLRSLLWSMKGLLAVQMVIH